MIIQLQENLKERGFKIILWAVIAAMLVGYAPFMFKGGGSVKNAIAQVNGAAISAAAYRQRLQREEERIASIRAQLGAQADSLLKALGMGNASESALASVVQDALIDDVANKIGISVSPEFVTSKLSDPNFVIRELLELLPFSTITSKGEIDVTALQGFLKRNGITQAEFAESVLKKVERSLALRMVDSFAIVLPSEIKTAYIQRYLPKDYVVVSVPLENFVKAVREKGVSDDDLKTFYAFENKKRRYWTPEMRGGKIIEFDAISYGSEPTADAVAQFYQQNKLAFVKSPAQVEVRRILVSVPQDASAEIVEQLQKKADSILEDVKKNPSVFGDLARKHSDDKKSAAQGGLITPFTKGTHSPEFDRTAFALKADGDISEVVPTNEGFEILQRVARKPIVYKTLEESRAEITSRLRKQKFQSAFSSDMARIINSEQASERLQELASQKGGRASEIGMQAKNDSLLSKKLFALRSGQWGFYTEGDRAFAVQLNTVKPSFEPELSTVRATVFDDYCVAEGTKLLKKEVAEARKKLAEGGDLEQIRAKIGGKIERINNLTSEQHARLQGLAKQGLSLEQFFAPWQVGETGSFVAPEAGFIFKIISEAPFDEKDFLSHRLEIAENLWVERKNLAEKAFIASLHRNATIVLSNTVND